MKKILAVLLILAMLVPLALTVSADTTARTMVIFDIEGKDVKMTKGTSKTYDAKSGTKLAAGYTVSTGKASYSYIKLDENSMAKLDEKTKVKVNKLSSKKLSLSVLSGSVAVNAGKQKNGDTLEVSGGNSALTVRGTIYIIEYLYDNNFIVYMLSGKGDVDGNVVEAGEIMMVSDNKTKVEKKDYEILKFKIGEDLSKFVLKTLLENKDELIKSGLFTEDDVPYIEELIKGKEKEKTEIGESNKKDIKNVLIYYDEPTTEPSTESSTNLPDGSTPPTTPPPGPYSWINWADIFPGPVSVNDTITLPNPSPTGGTEYIITGTIPGISIPSGVKLIIPSGVTVTIAPGGTLDVNPLGGLSGMTIYSGASVKNQSNTINIYGTVENNGTITNESVGSINIVTAYGATTNAMLINNGTIYNKDNAVINIDGQDSVYSACLYNLGLGTIENTSTASPGIQILGRGGLFNGKTINNYGIIYNYTLGELGQNFGFKNGFRNDVISCSGTINNYGEIINDGNFWNGDGQDSDSDGILKNKSIGTITNNSILCFDYGEIDNEGIIINNGSITFCDSYDVLGCETILYNSGTIIKNNDSSFGAPGATLVLDTVGANYLLGGSDPIYDTMYFYDIDETTRLSPPDDGTYVYKETFGISSQTGWFKQP